MPAHQQLARAVRKPHHFIWPALITALLLVQPSPAHTATMVNSRSEVEPKAAADRLMLVERTRNDVANLAIRPATISRLSPARAPIEARSSKIVEELGKQAIDQPGHFLIGAGPIWASRYLVGVPWYGWVITPLLAYREWLQWPSKRWWDPPLDWAFLSLGAVVATWRRSSRRSRNESFAPTRHRALMPLRLTRGRQRPSARLMRRRSPIDSQR
jgi:hypothetical protein